MIGVNKLSIFLLVLTLTDIINSVHGRSVEQAVLVYVVPEDVRVVDRDEGKNNVFILKIVKKLAKTDVIRILNQTVAPVIVPLSDSVSLSRENDRDQALDVVLEALKTVNENVLELVRTFVGETEQADERAHVVSLDTRAAVVAVDDDEEEISSRDLASDSTRTKKGKLPQLYVPQITLTPVNPQVSLTHSHY